MAKRRPKQQTSTPPVTPGKKSDVALKEEELDRATGGDDSSHFVQVSIQLRKSGGSADTSGPNL